MTDNSITISYEVSIQDCTNKCTLSGDGSCLGIVYDTQLTNGWENCSLKNATAPMVNSTSGSTVALLNSESNTPPGSSTASASGGGGSSPKSKAWIAGPIIGIVAAVATLIAAWQWARRKKSRRQAAGLGPQNQWYYYTAGKVELDVDGKERRPAPAELEALKSPIEMEVFVPPAELDGNERKQPKRPGRY